MSLSVMFLCIFAIISNKNPHIDKIRGFFISSSGACFYLFFSNERGCFSTNGISVIRSAVHP